MSHIFIYLFPFVNYGYEAAVQRTGRLTLTSKHRGLFSNSLLKTDNSTQTTCTSSCPSVLSLRRAAGRPDKDKYCAEMKQRLRRFQQLSVAAP